MGLIIVLSTCTYKGAARKKSIDLDSEQEHSSLDEKKMVHTWQNHEFYGGSLADV